MTKTPLIMRWWWVIVVCWRHANGGWFIFRDIPDDVVAELLEDPALGDQALDELSLRLHQMVTKAKNEQNRKS